MSLHLALAWLSAALVAIVLALVVIGRLRGRIPRFALDRAILAVEASVALGLLTGIVQLATTHGPDDPLHLVYAVVALAALPIGRAWRGLRAGPRPLPLGIAAVVVLGVLIRLAQTG